MFFNLYHLFTLLLPIPLDPRLYWDDALNLAGVVASLAHLIRLSLTAKAFWPSYRRAVALCYAGGGLPFLTVSNESIHASPLGVS